MRTTNFILLAVNLAAVAGIAAFIRITGGLPSQFAHLYYIPVVVSALLLSPRLSLPVALLAAAAVSPLPDIVHRSLGMSLYYPDAAPWNFSPSGWFVRPLAFIGISLLTGKIMKETQARIAAEAIARSLASAVDEERVGKVEAEATSVARGKELQVLSRIDKMILASSREEETLQEIARLVVAATGARVAEVAVPNGDGTQAQTVYPYSLKGEPTPIGEMPLGEGVSGWALLHGKTTTSPNVFADPRYERMTELARRIGYVSAAAVPIILEGQVIAALSVGYDQEREFSQDELGTLQRIADQAAIAVANARQRESLQQLAHETAIALAEAIESRDPYTGNHCSRLAELASLTARTLELPSREIEVVRLGAALHDVGKIVVPDEILKKPDKLTPDEYAIIKQHCYSGGQIVKRVSFLRQVYPIVYHHHERYDGHGYPDGIAGDKIPLGARIVAVVDAYDAMTSDRPYRKSMPDEEAEAILRDGAGSQWDPKLVETFLSGVTSPAQSGFEVRRERLGGSAPGS